MLGLDTSLKSTPEGFANYYALREELLHFRRHGWVRVELLHRRLATGGELSIVVEDSGSGFRADVPREARQFGGRGISLVRSLCRELSYEGCGNRVRATYAWTSLTKPCEDPIVELQPILPAPSAARSCA